MNIRRCLVICLFVSSNGLGAGLAVAETGAEQCDAFPTSYVCEIKVSTGNGDTIVDALNGLYKGVKLLAVEDKIVVIFADEDSRKHENNIIRVAKRLNAALEVSKSPSKDSGDKKLPAEVVRIFHQNAELIVQALKGTIEGVNLSHLGKDLLLVYGERDSEKEKRREVRRRIALLDLPQPKMSLQVWAFQLTHRDNNKVNKALNLLRSIPHDFDKEIGDAFERAWQRIIGLFDPETEMEVLDQVLYRYLNISTECKNKEVYCLEYGVAENAYPSMANMLVALALTRKPQRHIDAILEDMRSSSNHSGNSRCLGTIPRLDFRHFEHALNLLYGQTRRHLLKAALADFLFFYKWNIDHPDRLDVYGFSRSAEQLNTLFSPVFEAYMRDLDLFVAQFNDHPCWNLANSVLPEKKEDKETIMGLRYLGAIKVATVSGTQAKASANSVSHFDVTQPPDMATILSEKDTQLAALSTHIGGPLGQALSFLAAAASMQPTIVEISQGITLGVNPKALVNGTAAELDVSLTVSQDDLKRKVAGAEDTIPALDRVSKHEVETKVRVEAQRLFEISTFSNDVTMPRPDKPSWGLGACWHSVFGRTPFMNRFFLRRRQPETVSQSSLVMVQAAVVPTALDLAWSLRFKREDTNCEEKAAEEFKKFHKFHLLMRQCLVLPPRYRMLNPTFSKGCANLTYEDVRNFRGVQ